MRPRGQDGTGKERASFGEAPVSQWEPRGQGNGHGPRKGEAAEGVTQCAQAGRMELLGAVLLAASLLGTAARGAQAPWPDEPSHTCFFQTLSSPDSEFCRGDLEVTYPQLGDVGCSYIPQCHQYRWRLSREWGSPRVRYPRADKSKKYVLMLVDPDAPSRADPRNRFWRHWLLADVRGTDLRTGDLKGRVLTDYVRPTPPPRSGYHRYQLRLYEQPAGQHITLGPEELLSLGAWAMESFVERFRLGSPVASTQFLTKHHED
ncbi:phosphatidylethanolamine-binding protein 4 isoform X2 [Anser cygnoides]|uniref:phosphatidylethanolamine-binding protein 4 isoform X2 n=1 Tax=Anser cygnoides TaxID=8845 RepID=UPI0034D16BDA